VSADPTAGQPDSPQTRIDRALHYASEYGWIDGGHHKQWVIDQMVRALTGCPYEDRASRDGTYTYQAQGSSPAYTEFLGGDAEDDWAGIAP
jgi:hypothetical protein